MIAPYAVIADDLTGAADAGVQFVRAGLRTRTLTAAWGLDDLHGVEVVAAAADSRALPAAEAYARTYAAAARLRAAGSSIVYQKIDSTVRGSIGAQVEAVMDACALPLAIVCPAYPANGRSVVQGVVTIHNVPVAETAIAADPLAPLHQSHLPTLLAAQTQRPVRQLPATGGSREQAELAAALLALYASGGGLAVCDAYDDEHLTRIIAAGHSAAQTLAKPLLLVGSAGLARPLALRLAAARRQRVLVLCGSLHPVARKQVHHLVGRLSGGAHSPIAEAGAGPEECGPEEVETAFVSVMVTAACREPAAAAPSPAAALGEKAAHWLEAHTAAGFVVIGGDTLQALLHALQAHGVNLDEEILPGMPMGRIAGGPWAGLPIISKAGGFGEPSALCDAVRFLLAGTEERKNADGN